MSFPFLKSNTALARTVMAGAALCVSSFSFAQPALTEIVVTAKSEQTIADSLLTAHVFTADDIERIQAKDVTTLLQEIPGINIADSGGRGSNTGVFLRGASSGQTIVLVDGVRVGSATLGSAALNSYPLEAIQRIEVVKGPLSGIYGADAVGGVIQLFTQGNASSEPGGSVSASVGSDSLQEYGLAFRGGNENNNYYISAQSEETDGIDRTSIVTGGNDDIDAFEQQSLSLGGRVQLSESTSAQLAILYSDNSVEFDNTFGDDTGFFTDNETLSTALTFNTRLNPNLTWRTTLGINEDESITPAFNSEFTTDRNSLTSELSINLSATSSAVVGLDYYEEDITTLSDFPVTDRDNKSIYGLYRAQAGKLGLIANLRYDDNSAYGGDTNGSLAVDYQINDSLRAVASFGTAFVAPSFNSLYFPFFGNPDLVPEESETVELSLRGRAGAALWRLSAYQTEIENLFSFDPSTFLAANIGRAELEGIEAEVSTELAGWQVAASVDFLSAEDLDSNTELDDRAERSMALSAYRSWDNFDLRLAVHGESNRFDNRGTELSSYALLDLNAGYQFTDALSLQATVNNVFDKDYTVNLIGPDQRFRTEGRQARIKLRYQF